MHLLFLTPQLPHPPRQGTAIRNWGLLKSLAARHTITLLTFANEAEAISPELRATCQRLETVPLPSRAVGQRLRDLILSPLPDLAHRLASPSFAERFATLLNSQSFDALFIEGLELAPFFRSTPRALLPATIIFDAHNCETVLQRRAFQSDLSAPRRWPAALYSFIQSRKLARFEADTCRRATHVTCVSAEDAVALQAIALQTVTLHTRALSLKPVVIPNGIFLSDYSLLHSRAQPPTQTLIFTGKMDYRPNIDAVRWFADEILPLIQREVPEAQFVIVGQKPTEVVKKLSGRKGLIVTGAVEDTRPYIASAAVYVAPLRMGGGTRFKLLEAMALKRPIVSTTLGAEGFAVKNGHELSLADSARDFANAVMALLRDGAKRTALGEAGYEFVKQYDWERIMPELEKLLMADR